MVRVAKPSEDNTYYSPARLFVKGVISNRFCEGFISSVVVLGMVFVIVDVNLSADGIDEPLWLRVGQISLLVVYFTDMVAQAYVYRWKFFRDKLRVVDSCTIAVDVCVTVADLFAGTDFPVGLVRAARILKVTRVLRAMSQFPELNLLIRGTWLAARSLVWGVLLLLMTLSLWSVLAVVLIQPLVKELDEQGLWDQLNCERCPRAYRTWQNAMVTFCTTLVAGGDFGQVNIPLMEYYPATSIYFLVVLVVTMLLVLNLLMGLVVERAMEATKLSVQEEAVEKVSAFEHARQQLTSMVEDMDEDGDGCVSWTEFEDSFQTNKEFESYLRAMDIAKQDLKQLFHMLDADGDGLISSSEFSTQFYAMRHRDPHTMLSFLSCHVQDIHKQLKEMLSGGRTMSERECPAQRRTPRASLVGRGSTVENLKQLPPQLPEHTHALSAGRTSRALHHLNDLRRELIEIAADTDERNGPVDLRI